MSNLMSSLVFFADRQYPRDPRLWVAMEQKEKVSFDSPTPTTELVLI